MTTFLPWAISAYAKFVEKFDFQTPPLPLTTEIDLASASWEANIFCRKVSA